MDSGKKVEIVERYVSAYNARDIDTILSLYREDATMEDPYGTPPVSGKEALAALYQEGFDMGVVLALDGRPRCAGNAVAFPLLGTTEQGKLFIIDLFEFDADGRIERMRAYWGPESVEGEMEL
ncbi:MAG: steroid delta-isomerase [bacterium]|nr:steroid delta-isomerase [bacterium]